MLPYFRKRRAFSLIELSIVIVIIGLLLLGVVGSKHLVDKARINSSQAITRSSIINGTPDNKLWLESSLDELAFGDTYTTGDALSAWNDMSSNKTSISISVVGSGPTYSNSINSVQAVKFGSSSNLHHLQIDDASFLNGTNYTIFILDKRIDNNGSTGNYLLGGAANSFAIGYEAENKIIQTHGETADDDNQANIEALDSYSNKARVITVTHSDVDGNKIYVNGTLANEDSTSTAQAHLSGITTLAIGNNYNGEIGEIVIFDRDLKTVERRDIEDYLTDKWNAPNNRDSSASCTTGTITSTGCESSCSAPTINGTTTSTTSDGGTAEFTCNATGYASNTLTYTCSSGSLSPAPSASDCADVGCGSGYNEDGGECKAQCTITAQTGLASNTAVDSGSTSLSCDSGYTGSITYTCDNGTASSITNNCVAPLTCDLDAEAIPGVTQTGTVDQVVGGTLTCDGTGYDGQTITYDCNSSGEFENVGTCNCDAPLYLSDGSNCVSSSTLAWYDASDTSSITHSSNAVSQWSDKTSNGYHLTASGTRQPATNTVSINSLNVIDFDGSSDFMNNTALGTLLAGEDKAFSVFIVHQLSSATIKQQLWSVCSTSNNYPLNQTFFHNNLVYRSIRSTSNQTVTKTFSFGSGTKLLSTILTGTTVSDYYNGSLVVYDGGADNVNDVSSLATNNFAIGAQGRAIPGNYMDGSIAEMIIYDRAVTSSERTQIETYLNDKWSIW